MTTSSSTPEATGTPVWVEMSSTDLKASMRFYEQLFGWDFTAWDEEGTYFIIRCNGALVGGAFAAREDGGPRPGNRWIVSLAADDVEARTRLAAQHGAKIIEEPREVGGSGHYASIEDPTGAELALCEGDGALPSTERTGKTGSPVWFELMTRDYETALRFYEQVFEFTLVDMPMPEFRYSTNGPEENASSGICDARALLPEGMPSFWRIYLAVDACDAAIERVRELGGKLLDGPVDSPFGRFASVQDPAGAVFMICAPSEAVTEASFPVIAPEADAAQSPDASS